MDVKGAVRVVIEPGDGAVEASGDTEVKPGATTIYNLTATGPGGQVTTRSVRVVVESPTDAQTAYIKAVAERHAGHLQAALLLFRQAAELGETRAMMELGNISDDAKDYSEAVRWYRMAADRGNSDGMLLMGSMYSLGQGAPKDDAAAVYWFTKASDGGDADAKFNLGEVYRQGGLGVSKDLAKASEYYREASKLGNEDATRRLQQMSVGH